MSALACEINGRRVLAWAEGALPGEGIVLVQHRPEEWATAWYRQGDEGWTCGHYFDTRMAAWADFVARAISEAHAPYAAVNRGVRSARLDVGP